MSKRRKGDAAAHHQVPSLRALASHAVAIGSGRRVIRSRGFPNVQRRMDTDMAGGGGDSTENRKRSRSAAQQGALEVGQGLEVVVPRNIPRGYNNSYTVCLSYGDARVIPVSMAGGYDIRTWSANGIYDPDISATGHQPMLRDLWASQYDYYTVLACRYRFELYNCLRDPITYTAVGTSSQLIGGCLATVIPTTNSADIGALGVGLVYPATEMKNTISKCVWPEGPSVIFEGELTPGDFIVDAKDADDDKTWTAVGSNPTVQRYIAQVINSMVNAALTGQSEQPYAAIHVLTTLEYDVQFTQMNQSIRSLPS